MNASVEEKTIGFLSSLASECKNCHYKGASCNRCKINGIEGLLAEIKEKNTSFEMVKSETRQRKDIIIKHLVERPLPAREIKIACTSDLKNAALVALEQDGEIEVIRTTGRQNIYKLANTATETQQEKSKS